MGKKVMIGMSGGVDSSVAALVLKEQGYEVVGVTFKLWDDVSSGEDSKCCSLDDVNDARLVCNKLDIPHYVFNYKEVFQEKVIDYFIDQYEKGHTPNPCIACNRYIKFDIFLERAKQMGFDYISTGHYAVVEKDEETGRYNLVKGAFDKKDQSYVLYTLTQEQLEHLLLPLGNMEKEEVRAIAKKEDLIVASKPDSQDICFIPSGDYKSFLEKATGKKAPKGNFMDLEGNVLGKHTGIWNYTIGQRKGLGITFGKPMFVADIIPENNTVVLSEEDGIFKDYLIANDLNLISVEKITQPVQVEAKIRYAHKKAPATLYPHGEDGVKVVFDSPQRAITKGQAVVFYQGDKVFGGGTIVG